MNNSPTAADCWVEIDGFAGRFSIPAVLIDRRDDQMRSVRVKLLAPLKVNGRRFETGTVKRVPRRSVVFWPSAVSKVVAPSVDEHRDLEGGAA